MPWYAYVLLAWFAFSAVVTILWIGKPRPVVTPGGVLVAVVATALETWAVIALARGGA